MAATGSAAPESAGLPPRLAKSLLLFSFLVLVATAGLLSWHSMGILDIWLHNQVGHDLLAGNGFSGTNTYSFVQPDHPWINHEWLFQILVAGIGPARSEAPERGILYWSLLRLALSLLLVVVLVLGDGTLARLRSKAAVSPGRPWLALPLLLGLMLLWPRLVLRPELVSCILYVALVRLADSPLATWAPGNRLGNLLDPRRRMGAVFWLTVLWAQFHGFASLAPLILLLAILTRGLERKVFPSPTPPEPSPGRWWLAAIPLSLVALCLSPNGIQGLVYPLRALGQFGDSAVDLRGSISELVPLLNTRDSLGLTLIAYKVSLVWGLGWVILTWGRTSLLRVTLWSLAAFAAYAGQRNIGFYAVAFILLHTGTTGAPLAARLTAPWKRTPQAILWGAALVLLLAGALPWWVQITGDGFYLAEGVSRRFGSGVNPGRYPEPAARMLASRPGTHLFNNVDSAAYLLNRADARLFIDGRTEAYSSRHWQVYEQLKKGGPQALAVLERYQPQGAFLSFGGGAFHGLIRDLLASEQWGLVHRDETGFFFTRRGPDQFAEGPGIDPGALPGILSAAGSSLSPARAADLCLAWATTLELSGQADLQEQVLRRGLDYRPDHPALQHNLGNILLARGELASARKLFVGALAVNGRLSGSALNAGVCRMKEGDPGLAREYFRRAARINPENFEAWANLGLAWLADGNKAEGARALEKARQLQPGNQGIRKLLRQIRADG